MDIVVVVFNGWLSFSQWMLLKMPVTLQKSCISLDATGMRVLGVTTTEEIPTKTKQYSTVVIEMSLEFFFFLSIYIKEM